MLKLRTQPRKGHFEGGDPAGKMTLWLSRTTLRLHFRVLTQRLLPVRLPLQGCGWASEACSESPWAPLTHMLMWTVMHGPPCLTPPAFLLFSRVHCVLRWCTSDPALSFQSKALYLLLPCRKSECLMKRSWDASLV